MNIINQHSDRRHLAQEPFGCQSNTFESLWIEASTNVFFSDFVSILWPGERQENGLDVRMDEMQHRMAGWTPTLVTTRRIACVVIAP